MTLAIAVVILAGGEGRRMGGRDKALLPLAGQPLLAHVLARLRRQTGGAVALSANGDPQRFAGFDLPVLEDQRSQGPLSGILAGLDWLATRPGDAAGLVSLPVDAPFLPVDLLARLSADPARPAYAEAGGRGHYATAYWPQAVRHPLAAFLASGAKTRIADFMTAQGGRAVGFDQPGDFDNLNRPEDLAQAEWRLAQLSRGLL